MTFKRLKSLTNALLIGDNNLTKNNDEVLGLLSYAYSRVANEADALKLLTANSNEDMIIRNGIGNLYIRMPKLPENDNDELDIDEELCYAVARFMASFVSKQKFQIHELEAQRIIQSYNHKVSTFIEKLEQDGVLKMYGDTDKIGKIELHGIEE